jgi:hypothetical protein
VSLQINYPSSAGVFADSTRANNLGAVFEGYVTVPTADVYTFFTTSDEGSRLRIGTATIVENDGIHGMRERSGSVALRRGTHALRIEFFEREGNAGLIASVQSPEMPKQVIPAAMLVRAVPPPPCPPDFNGDGFLDFFDYDDFVIAYETGDPSADYNADGFLDFFDYDDFVEDYEAGC